MALCALPKSIQVFDETGERSIHRPTMEYEWEGKVCAVTGAAGFVGRRLVEMLLESGGAASVIAIDIMEPEEWTKGDSRLKYHKVDITVPKDVSEALRGADCVWHVAALVGPYHSHDLYMKVRRTHTHCVFQRQYPVCM